MVVTVTQTHRVGVVAVTAMATQTERVLAKGTRAEINGEVVKEREVAIDGRAVAVIVLR